MSIAFYISVCLVGTGLFWGYIKAVTAFQKKTIFNLFEVRDDLIYLVATNVLSEDSLVFQHYYKRVNGVINQAPNIGLDTFFAAIFHIKDSDTIDLDEVLTKAKQKADEIIKNPEFENREVCRVVENYYRSVSKAVLFHSKFGRIAFIIANRLTSKVVRSFWYAITPHYLIKVLKVAKYTEDEADQIHVQCLMHNHTLPRM